LRSTALYLEDRVKIGNTLCDHLKSILLLNRYCGVICPPYLHQLVLWVLYLLQNLDGLGVSHNELILCIDYEHGGSLLTQVLPRPLLLIQEVTDRAYLGQVVEFRVIEVVRVVCHVLRIARSAGVAAAEREEELHEVEELVAPLVLLEDVCVVAEERCN
jgi:hypothetical protein